MITVYFLFIFYNSSESRLVTFWQYNTDMRDMNENETITFRSHILVQFHPSVSASTNNFKLKLFKSLYRLLFITIRNLQVAQTDSML